MTNPVVPAHGHRRAAVTADERMRSWSHWGMFPRREQLTDEARAAILALCEGKLKRGSPAQLDALHAVAWCQINGNSVDLDIKVVLANMFSREMRDTMPVRFEVVRNRAGARDRGRELEIAKYVGRYIDAVTNELIAATGNKMDVFEDAAEKFGRSARHVEDVWSNWRRSVAMRKHAKT